MYGFTGTYKGKRVSVQGSGMGVPSISIYANELMNDYGVKKLIRVGTAGAMSTDVKIRDVVIAQAATSDSRINQVVFGGTIDYAPIADFDLLYKAYNNAKEAGLSVKVGNIFTADSFYSEEAQTEKLARYGVLAVEMESTALYTLAAKYGRQALTILTISDHLITGEVTSAEERQTTLLDMMKIALETAIAE